MSKDADIQITYIQGLPRDSFEAFENLELEVDLPPEEENLRAIMSLSRPEDFIIVFAIYFTKKVVDRVAEGIGDKIVEALEVTVKRTWKKFRNQKPAIITAREKPDPKEPKALLKFQLSEDESVLLEIKGDLTEEELDALLKAHIETVKERYNSLNN